MAKMTLDDLVAQLSAIYAHDLVGVALYGSAARGEHVAKHSDLNVIVVVQRISMEHLRKEAPVARGWREAGNPPPLTMTRAEWLLYGLPDAPTYFAGLASLILYALLLTAAGLFDFHRRSL